MVSRYANSLAYNGGSSLVVCFLHIIDKCQGHFSFTVPNGSYPFIFKDRVSSTVHIEFEIQVSGVTVCGQFPFHDFYVRG